MKNSVLFLFVFFNVFNFANGADHFERMKAYRNYYTIQKVYPMAHSFSLYLDTSEGRVSCQFLGNTETDLKMINCGTGLFAVAPDKEVELPKSIKNLKTKALDIYLEKNPGEKILSVFEYYKAKARRIDIKEYTPLDPKSAKTHRRGAASLEFRLTIFANGRAEMHASGFGIGRGFGGLCDEDNDFGDSCNNSQKFVDYSMPDWMDGSSFADLYNFNQNSKSELKGLPKTYLEEWQKFAKKAEQAADAITNKTYDNPINEILSRQSEEKLDENLNQQLNFSFSVTVKTKTKQVSHDIEMKVPSKSFFKQKSYEYEFFHNELKTTFFVEVHNDKVKLGLRDGSKILVENSGKMPKGKKSFLEDSKTNQQAIENLFGLENDQWSIDVTLPGGVKAEVQLPDSAFSSNVFLPTNTKQWGISSRRSYPLQDNGFF